MRKKDDLLKSILFRRYKSIFADGGLEIDMQQNVSLFIGRNNCGKSSIIDVIEKAFSVYECSSEIDELNYSFEIDETHILNCFPNEQIYTTTRLLPLHNPFVYAKQYIGKNIFFNWERNDKGEFELKISMYQKVADIDLKNDYLRRSWDKTADKYGKNIKNIRLRRINADRDISQEIESEKEFIDENGRGTTNLIRKFINSATYDENIVEQTLLEELNKIMNPDSIFDGIRVQQVKIYSDGNYKWEIFLVENGKRFALSRCGSGLKTIILILANLLIVPQLPEYKDKIIIFAFEEIENNLHPALQRRVFEYIYDFSLDNDIIVFLTSHSHIAINTFFGKTGTKIYHISKSDKISSVRCIEADDKANYLLDDLGVKASDLFQANGIIWVEGPSDRIYINKWLSVFCRNELKEGVDYQYAYYGGRLLSHYTINDDLEQKNKELLNVLKTNRHAAIVMDSDKKSYRAPINETKKRIKEEFMNSNLFCWITKGKEIENYVSFEAINRVHNSNLGQIGQFDSFANGYISKTCHNFSENKVGYAREYCKYITKDNSFEILDLNKKISELYEVIKKWSDDSGYMG